MRDAEMRDAEMRDVEMRDAEMRDAVASQFQHRGNPRAEGRHALGLILGKVFPDRLLEDQLTDPTRRPHDAVDASPRPAEAAPTTRAGCAGASGVSGQDGQFGFDTVYVFSGQQLLAVPANSPLATSASFQPPQLSPAPRFKKPYPKPHPSFRNEVTPTPPKPEVPPPPYHPSLDFFSKDFDATKALRTPGVEPPNPRVRPLDNLNKIRRILPAECEESLQNVAPRRPRPLESYLAAERAKSRLAVKMEAAAAKARKDRMPKRCPKGLRMINWVALIRTCAPATNLRL
ncbi:hypothetical protein CYMTET_35152 [Cymbomonas tetramitiformis]|uniref:Uncharacterized protein n=1 Tax=Cymbomonas tetramitiformis TaxID=36881 RepID=A0AAE0KP90_9CHLO|nr:hypothetical protein CYMTET_35152 [Cymbomonas tetramitiformis]